MSTAVRWEQVLAWRMRRQHLLERATPAGLVDVVARMGGLHAQVMSSVELSLGARVDGLALEDVREALWGQRTLVKLWAMRGTLHVLPARDLGVWLAALGTYRDGWPMYSMHDPLMHELAELVGHALRGRLLTRLELAAEVSRLSGSVAAGESLQGGWGGALKPASFLGRLCFAPSAGQRVRFTHPDTWIGAAPVRPAEDAAMAEIVRRFLGAYGPATPVDLAGWWGATRREATRMLALVEDQVTEVDVEGEPYWMLADQVAKLAATEPSEVVRLLPGFDQWTVCASRRVGPRSRPGPGTPALDPRHRTRIYRCRAGCLPYSSSTVGSKACGDTSGRGAGCSSTSRRSVGCLAGPASRSGRRRTGWPRSSAAYQNSRSRPAAHRIACCA